MNLNMRFNADEVRIIPPSTTAEPPEEVLSLQSSCRRPEIKRPRVPRSILILEILQNSE